MLPRINATGNLTRDPELRFTPSGKAVCNVAMACNDRRKNADGRWEDGDTTFLDVTVWGDDAEALAGCATKGQRVTVEGRLAQRSYETREGDKRTVYEATASQVTLALPRNESARSSASSTTTTTTGDPWATTGTPPAPPF